MSESEFFQKACSKKKAFRFREGFLSVIIIVMSSQSFPWLVYTTNDLNNDQRNNDRQHN